MTALPRVGLVMSLLLSASCASLTYANPDAARDAGAVETGALDVGTPDAGSADLGVPDVGVPDVGDPDVGVPDVGTPDVGVPDVGVDVACSADTSTDRMNCGRCGVVCGTPRGTTQNTCAMGRCVPVCATSFGDCDGDPNNGCEAELNSEDRCGSCTTVCLSNQACLPPPPPDMGGMLRCVNCGRRNNACCHAPAAACESGLRCDGMVCVM